jgi:16S rRNA (cytosine1402-N4)-methyltransferase
MDYHIPVLAEDAVAALNITEGSIYVDATLGGGGYSEMILSRTPNQGVRLLSFDTDPQAIEYASKRLERFRSQFKIIAENFANLEGALFKEGIGRINGIVYDLGVSSRQLDTTSVGLSYRIDAPLDMRLDPRLRRNAKDIIAETDEEELKHIFGNYGEEPMSGRIARWIVEARSKQPIETTTQLAAIVTRGIREDKKNATLSRIFQALRIEVNDELGSLRSSLKQALELLEMGGRIVVVSYHSLEDRIVKDFFTMNAKPVVEAGSLESLKKNISEENAKLKLITRKPIVPSDEEIRRNPRARSAKMRVAEKRDEGRQTNDEAR